jgi:galactonate dehydratase
VRITAVKSYPVLVAGRTQLLVKVESDGEVHGWGESGLTSRERAVAGAVDHFAGFLVGCDPRRVGALWQEMYRSQYFEGGRVLLAAMSAIDIALHDLKAKALGVPVYELLGGRQRDRVPTFATASAQDGEELVTRARTLARRGWGCVRLGISEQDRSGRYEPWESLVETAARVTAVRHELGPAVALGIDFHHRLSVAEAASFCQRLAPGTLDFLEEPIRDESPAAYKSLRRLTNVPFAIGEELASKWLFVPYLHSGLAQYCRVDVCNVGGLSEAMKVAAMSETHYIDLMPHNAAGAVCLAASVQLAAAVPNLAWLECRESPGEEVELYDDAFCRHRPRLDGTCYPVGDAPGLGVEIDERALEAARCDPRFEVPHLRRRDGSVTNW